MRQLITVFIAMAAGLAVGRLTGGAAFSPAICIFAGLLLVTPALVSVRDPSREMLAAAVVPVLWTLGLWALMGAVSLGIGLLSGDAGIAAGLFLIGLLPGGGMVMAWIRQSGADPATGVILLAVNLGLVLPATLVFDQFPVLAGGLLDGVPTSGGLGNLPPLAPFLVLVVLPWFLSRWLREDAPRLAGFIERHRAAVAAISIALIVFYLFSLRSAQALFAVPPGAVLRAAAVTLGFYAVAWGLALVLVPRDAGGRAVAWHLVTRYVTLALILAGAAAESFGPTFLLPLTIAYVVQLAGATLLGARLAPRVKDAGRAA